MNNAGDNKRKALGKGLSSLLPGRTSLPPSSITGGDGQGGYGYAAALKSLDAADKNPTSLAIDDIQPNPLQPRTIFQAEKLEEIGRAHV